MKTETFKSLPVGTVFEFVPFSPWSGEERGPWTKISARCYEKKGPRAMRCRVGSVRVEVVRVSP